MKVYILVFIWCCIATCAMAKVIHLVTGNNYQPYTDESLPNRGMVTEIVDLVFKEMGYDPQIAFRPWKRGYVGTKKNFFAGTFPYIKSDERLKDFYFSDSIHEMYIRVFVAKDSSIQSLEDLPKKRICIPLGYAVSKRLEQLVDISLQKKEVNPSGLAGCLRMIRSGRKDFFVINESNGWMLIQKIYETKDYFRTLDTVFEEETHHLIVSKSYPGAKKIILDFNQGLRKLKEKGLVRNIMNRHLQNIHAER